MPATGLPLHIISYDDLYGGWTMDKVVAQAGRKSSCTFCGVFRRQALDRGAATIGATKIATGHNADDIAETVLMNVLRGDFARLGRCVSAVTGGEFGRVREKDVCVRTASQPPTPNVTHAASGDLPRVKPFKRAYEKEIVMYAYFKK